MGGADGVGDVAGELGARLGCMGAGGAPMPLADGLATGDRGDGWGSGTPVGLGGLEFGLDTFPSSHILSAIARSNIFCSSS